MKNTVLILEERHLTDLPFPSWAVTAWLRKALYP